MRIATNVSAIVSNNALQKSQDRLTKSIARLSSDKYVITGIRMAEIIALTILPTPSCAVTAYVTILTMNPRAASAK